jgi:cell division transport system permease protein
MVEFCTTKKQENMSFEHRVSFFIVCARACKYAVQNIVRNFGMTFITITILALALISVNTLVGLRGLTGAAVKAVEQQVDVSIFFTPSASEAQIEQVKNYVYEVAAVTKTDYISPSQALTMFRERHATDADIVKSLDVLEENPLGAILVVRTKDTADYKKILTALASDNFKTIIQKRSFEDRGKIVENVQLLTSRLEQFSLGLAILFALIAVMIIFNAIRVAIYTQREEISIKKLVGATNGFIRAPFLIEAAIYVAVAIGLTAAVIAGMTKMIDPFLGPLFAQDGFSLYGLFFSQHGLLFFVEFGIVLAIAWITATFAMSKYLRT